ncbi:unnamed protein product [Meganyctiphanes norvegica]|uniref:Uncharacterized protein n=1 Tax=Meganyctiphanes norvegica TaxID=48144 RepID=A0AAV2QQR5_MEGNR
MSKISYVGILFCLAFGLVYGNDECKNQKEGLEYYGCPVYTIESQQVCSLVTNDVEGNFVFYIKPLTKGQLSISLRDRNDSRSYDVFTVTMKDADTWYKVKVRRNDTRDQFDTHLYYYYLDINDPNYKLSYSYYEARKEIQVKTVSSLWTSECDPQYPQSPTEHLLPPLPPKRPLSSTQPSTQPPIQSTHLLSAATTVKHKISIPETNSASGRMNNQLSGWQYIVIASIAMICVTILIAVILVLKHKRMNPDPLKIQLTYNPGSCFSLSPTGDEPGTMPHKPQPDGPGTITMAGPGTIAMAGLGIKTSVGSGTTTYAGPGTIANAEPVNPDNDQANFCDVYYISTRTLDHHYEEYGWGLYSNTHPVTTDRLHSLYQNTHPVTTDRLHSLNQNTHPVTTDRLRLHNKHP